LIHQQISSIKKYWLWVSLVVFALVASFLSFIALISLWVGLKHIYQPGSWLPILAGAMALPLILGLFFIVSRRLLGYMKEKDLINL